MEEQSFAEKAKIIYRFKKIIIKEEVKKKTDIHTTAYHYLLQSKQACPTILWLINARMSVGDLGENDMSAGKKRIIA